MPFNADKAKDLLKEQLNEPVTKQIILASMIQYPIIPGNVIVASETHNLKDSGIPKSDLNVQANQGGYFV